MGRFNYDKENNIVTDTIGEISFNLNNNDSVEDFLIYIDVCRCTENPLSFMEDAMAKSLIRELCKLLEESYISIPSELYDLRVLELNNYINASTFYISRFKCNEEKTKFGKKNTRNNKEDI